ncbi:hypothetical protein MKW98_008833 [Papaver atlanticum]|uniref:Uncharacterized protein n=1 Tax=Papaver atlanticum TaxID=357466 RepID=A0AAD4S8U1_9MAGN|nr:hypothetical protein MKW98_008833 [Papaver atlanticum]
MAHMSLFKLRLNSKLISSNARKKKDRDVEQNTRLRMTCLLEISLPYFNQVRAKVSSNDLIGSGQGPRSCVVSSLPEGTAWKNFKGYEEVSVQMKPGERSR